MLVLVVLWKLQSRIVRKHRDGLYVRNELNHRQIDVANENFLEFHASGKNILVYLQSLPLAMKVM